MLFPRAFALFEPVFRASNRLSVIGSSRFRKAMTFQIVTGCSIHPPRNPTASPTVPILLSTVPLVPLTASLSPAIIFLEILIKHCSTKMMLPIIKIIVSLS